MLLVDTFVAASVIEGVGVFAAEPIQAGQLIYRFDPGFDRIVSQAEIAALPESIRRFIDRYTYPHPTDRAMLVLDVDNGRHMNHSLEPNTDFTHSVFGYAIRDIAIGEEITCNYAEFEPDFELLPSPGAAARLAAAAPVVNGRHAGNGRAGDHGQYGTHDADRMHGHRAGHGLPTELGVRGPDDAAPL